MEKNSMLDKIKPFFGIISIVIAVAGGVIAAEDRYLTEDEGVESIQQLQQHFDTKMDMIQYDFVTDQYFKIKYRLQDSPEDTQLSEEYDRIKRKREKLQERLGLE